MVKPVLVCLHGWGGSKESFTEMRAALNQSLRSDSGQALEGAHIDILTPDLPGFGDEPEPKTPWTVDDYATWVEHWINKERPNAKEIHLLGHSHGGRIAVRMATRGNVRIAHLYLCASAGIRHGRHFKRIVGLTLAKSGKLFLSIPGLNRLAPLGRKALYKLVRVHDYEKASAVMRQTLINVTREDFRNELNDVRLPTDIFWGTDDRMTPVTDANEFHKRIAGSRVHIYKGIRHNVHREKAKEIAGVVRKEL